MAAQQKWAFAKKHPLDIGAVVLPVLRPLRLLRLLTLLDVLNRYAGSSFRGRVGIYLAASASLIVFMGSLAIFDAERDGQGPIQTFGVTATADDVHALRQEIVALREELHQPR